MAGMDPRALKSMMAQMGIKTTDINALRVVIECSDKNIVISNPAVTRIEARGMESFQIVGNIVEEPKVTLPSESISADDVALVSEQSGVSDTEKVRKAILSSNGDLAGAILLLKKEAER